MVVCATGWINEYQAKLSSGRKTIDGLQRWRGQDWRREYEARFLSAEDAAHLVKPGDRVVFSSGREAVALGHALATRRDDFRKKSVSVVIIVPNIDFGWYGREWQVKCVRKLWIRIG